MSLEFPCDFIFAIIAWHNVVLGPVTAQGFRRLQTY